MADIKLLKEQLINDRRRARQWNELYSDAESELAEQIKALKEIWETSNAELIASRNEANADLFSTESELRNAMIEDFAVNKNKKIDNDLSVRVNTTLVYDQTEAMKWAKSTGMALTLDKSAFEKIAKAANLDFVQEVENPIAVIAKNISEE